MEAGRHQHAARGLVRAHRHQHGLGQRRSAVVERGVGDVEAGERRHHALEFVQHLQRALARFGLVGRVGGIEFAARGDLPYGGGDVVRVGARADEVEPAAILCRALFHEARDGHFVEAGREVRRAVTQVRGDFVEKRLDRVGAECGEHRGDVFGSVRGVGHGRVGRRGGRPLFRPCAGSWRRRYSASTTAW
jgi:hypothetical protein